MSEYLILLCVTILIVTTMSFFGLRQIKRDEIKYIWCELDEAGAHPYYMSSGDPLSPGMMLVGYRRPRTSNDPPPSSSASPSGGANTLTEADAIPYHDSGLGSESENGYSLSRYL